MSRDPTSISDELERLRAGAPPADYLARKGKLFDAQVSGLADRLQSDVRASLEREASSGIAGEWVEEAVQALKAIAPELPGQFEQRPKFQEAASRVRAELSERVLRDLIKPGDEEIRTHARELAQCVLANWFAALEHAMQDDPGSFLELSANGLPADVDHNAVLEGIEDFAVPANTVAGAFREYLDALKQSGQVVELAPDLYLAHKGTDTFVAGSPQTARRLVAPESKAWPKRSLFGARPLSAFFDQLTPYLNSSPGILGRTPKPSVAAALTDEQVDMYARLVVFQAFRDPSRQHGKLAFESGHGGESPDDAQLKVTSDLANYVLLDYEQALDGGTYKNFFSRWEQRGVEKRLTQETAGLMSEGLIESTYRVCARATACAFLGIEEEIQESAIDPSDLDRFMSSDPRARDIVNLATQTTVTALEMPQAKRIAEQMKQMITMDSSSWTGDR